MVGGQIAPSAVLELPLPPQGHVSRYIFTSAQNNTLLHPGWRALLQYAQWLDKQPNSSCQFHVGRYTYAHDLFGAKEREHVWYAPEIAPYIHTGRVALAPGLIWCGELNILPTTRYPLSGLETYNGRASNIVPHAKITMDSVPSLRGEGTKFNFSTGTITQRNYIQKRTGQIAEQGHCYGGLLVEVDSFGSWFVRQLHIGPDDAVCDIGPAGYRPVCALKHDVWEGDYAEAIVWGDIHASEMSEWISDLGWGYMGMLDNVRPRFQIMHDLFSMRSRSPHEWADFHKSFEAHVRNRNRVQDEISATVNFLHKAHRDWCKTIIVPSNHDAHLDRWLNEFDPRKDIANARYHYRLQGIKLELIENGDDSAILPWALRDAGLIDDVEFLELDESFVLCDDMGGIECGLHGHLGPGGARGSTRNLTKLGRAVVKGHDHTAAIRDNVYSVGVCSEDLPYVKGPLSHSASHCVIFKNGARQIVTMWKGQFRA